ncbi:hypothetical protein B0T14DRAFT_425191 [Immersiella caudata]|uniref:Uncharacterized protein n=1 Tax=Immersiella caudata TaxID=314043 RepID=A0AA39WWZ0_9PEZI|nr:hypothetical protein B0T14DRAFT_425191 [Immersiella caudata]
MSSGSDRELRRRFNRDPEPPNEGGRPTNILSSSSLPPLRSLHRLSNMSSAGGSGSRSSRYHRDRIERHRLAMEGRSQNASLDDVSRTLDDANSHLRALLDLHTPQPAISPPLQTNDHPEDNRRIKRRKLDSDKIAPSYKCVRYGRYGQLEPGQLTMEIVSCDGGVFSPDGSNFTAENILKNDTSVYCTKSYRCNIVLSHSGGTPFSLKELTIKAPSSNRYSSPVREGMVFVSMNHDELFTRTAQYQIQYLPSRVNPSGSLPAIYSIRHDDGVPRIRPRGAYPPHHGEDDDECKTAQIPSEFTSSSPPFNVTYEYGEDHEDDGAHPGFIRSNRRTPNRIGMLPFESDNSDDGADAWGPSASDWSSFEDIVVNRHPYSSRGHGDHETGGMTLDEAREANQIATQEAVRAVGGELMAPLVHFNIETDKNKCTIKFDPPVSGRFILLKMWTPYHNPNKNIDIQAVVAKGFAGPRYFTSVSVR